MSSVQARGAMRTVFVTLCHARSARRFLRSALMSMVLGVSSTQLIRMDRVLSHPDFIEIKDVFTDLQKREKLDKKKKKKDFFTCDFYATFCSFCSFCSFYFFWSGLDNNQLDQMILE
jgi:hypothetical protein